MHLQLNYFKNKSNTQKYLLIFFALEIIQTYCVCMTEILHNDVLLGISFQVRSLGLLAGNLNLAIMAVLTLWKLANVTNQDIPPPPQVAG